MRYKIFRSPFALMLMIGLAMAGAPKTVQAATTLTVSTNADSGPGSLRQAILDASDGETINFDANYTITLYSQLPVIDKTLTINGNGTANTIIEASTCNPVTLPGRCTPATFRVFEVSDSGNLTLDELTIRHGSDGVYLGSVYNLGTLAVTNSTFSGNSASGAGGGILNNVGTVTVTDSTFLNNESMYEGGGIFNYETMTVMNSTFSGNYGVSGGGIENAGSLTVTNSTFSNNAANSGGGGIKNYTTGTLTVTNSTFSSNYDGGIVTTQAETEMKSGR